MADGFAQNFIAGVQAGQAHKRSKKQQEWDEEDRGIEKDILAHRMKELKIQERIRARQAAEENLNTVQGTPEADVSLGTGPGQGSGMPSDLASSLGQPPNPVQMNPMDIPGIEELGIPGVSRRPQTMEQVLASQMTAARMKALSEPYTLPEGGTRMLGPTVIGRGSAKREPTVSVTERDARGKETTRRILESEAMGKTFTKEPLPRQAIQMLAPDQLNDFVSGVLSGNVPADSIPRSALGVRLSGMLSKQGYNVRMAQNDLRALRTHYQTLNSGERADIMQAADAAESALTDLEDLNGKWDAGGLGTWNAARLALAKQGRLGTGEKAATAQKLAVDLEGAIQAARDSIAQVATGGSGSVNKALDDAAKLLSTDFSSTRLKSGIDRVRTNLSYRTGAIRNAQPILPSEAGGEGAGGGGGGLPKSLPGTKPTAAQVAKALKASGRANDAGTVGKVMASPAAMAELFPASK